MAIVSLNIQPPVIGHRGASGYAPENTLVAFTKAAQLGCRWLEFDVMLAACGKPIVFHDETLNRTTNGAGRVDQYTYAQLTGLDAGSWFHPHFASEPIPALEDVMVFLKTHQLAANVEIKPLPGQDIATVDAALSIVQAYFPQPNASILFSSFSVEALRHLRQQSPTCLLGLLLHEWEPDWESVSQELNCNSVHVNEAIMTQAMASHIKSMHKKLLCYTVNDPARAKQLYTWGVDAVFSDVPDIILKACFL